MPLPAIAARAVLPAAERLLIRRVSAWAATAEMGQLSAFKAFLKRHPMLTNIAGTAGITSIIDSALQGDANSIQALSDAAEQAGIKVGDVAVEAVASQSPGLFDRAVNAVSSAFQSGDESVTDEEAAHALRMRDFARFIRTEVSGNKEYVLRYHANMREFLAMDAESVANLVEAY